MNNEIHQHVWEISAKAQDRKDRVSLTDTVAVLREAGGFFETDLALLLTKNLPRPRRRFDGFLGYDGNEIRKLSGREAVLVLEVYHDSTVGYFNVHGNINFNTVGELRIENGIWEVIANRIASDNYVRFLDYSIDGIGGIRFAEFGITNLRDLHRTLKGVSSAQKSLSEKLVNERNRIYEL